MARFVHTVLTAGFVVALVLSASSSFAAEAQVDAFIDASAQTALVVNTNVLQNTVGSTVRVDPNLNGVIGEVRELTVTADLISSGADFVVSGVFVASPTGTLQYSSTSGADGSITLLYDRNGSGLNAFLEFAMGIRVQVLGADIPAVMLPGMDVTVTLTDGAMSPVSVTQTVTLPVMSMAPLDLDFPFSSFAGIDPASLFAIQVFVDPQQAGDMQLGPIQTFGTPLIENICDDGIDNNNNGFIDCADTGCIQFPGCAILAPAMSPVGTAAALALLAAIGAAAIVRTRRQLD